MAVNQIVSYLSLVDKICDATLDASIIHRLEFATMDTSYATLIAREREKIEFLRAKIAECQKRIAALESMKDDDLDMLMAKSMGKSAPPESQVSTPLTTPVLQPVELQEQGRLQIKIGGSARVDGPKKKIGTSSLLLLKFIGSEGKSLDELEAYSSSIGLPHNRGSLRSFAHNYKQNYGFLDSPGNGFFKLSEYGLAYLASLKSETPPVGAGGVSGTST